MRTHFPAVSWPSVCLARCQTFCNNVAQMNAFCFKLQSTIITFCPLKLFKISLINFACHTRSFKKYPKKSSTNLQIILSPTGVVPGFYQEVE